MLIRTVEDENALPLGSIVLLADGVAAQVDAYSGTVTEKTSRGKRFWRTTGSTYIDSPLPARFLPATLLHPTWFDQEDVERVARALFEAEDTAQGYPIELCRWEAENPNDPHDPLSWHAYWEDRARAALAALGEVVE